MEWCGDPFYVLLLDPPNGWKKHDGLYRSRLIHGEITVLGPTTARRNMKWLIDQDTPERSFYTHRLFNRSGVLRREHEITYVEKVESL